ncbi:MAG: hypothetical protein ACR2MY_14350 [Candidatus Dormibacteria bacterium]
MGRNEFALGVLLGSLAGLAAGYVLRRGSTERADEQYGPETIDLTPALARRNAAESTAGTAGLAE